MLEDEVNWGDADKPDTTAPASQWRKEDFGRVFEPSAEPKAIPHTKPAPPKAPRPKPSIPVNP